jgi:hypothetical protein
VEVAVGLAKAFENVRRDVLLREAESMGYPADPILASLCMYSMKRRPVHKGCVGGEMHPKGESGPGVRSPRGSCAWSWPGRWKGCKACIAP